MKEVPFLESYKLNPQSIYHCAEFQITCSLNLLEFGKHQFNDSFIIKNLDALEVLCATTSQNNPPKQEQLKGFVFNSLIDSIKISMCFENFAKSMLLVQGYLVHDINKDVYPKLAKKQKDEPVYIEDLPDEWIISDNIKTQDESLKRVKKGLLHKTINYSTTLNQEAYIKTCKYKDEHLDLLKRINSYRNQLHLSSSLNFILRDTTYSEYLQLHKFVKDKFPNFMAQIQQQIASLEFGQEPSLKITRNA